MLAKLLGRSGAESPGTAGRKKSQFAEEVVNFSSQYGTNGTSSYVARNLAGPPTIPRYGDFIEAFVLVRVDSTMVSSTHHA